jgi:transmembrane sensor
MREHTAMRPERSRTPPGRWRWIVSLTLLAVLGASIAWIAAGPPRDRSIHQPPARETVLSTQLGQHDSVKLADGTQLVLNTESRVRADRISHRVVLERGEVIAALPPPSTVPEYTDCPLVFDVGGGVDFQATAASQFRIRKDGNGVVLVDVLAGKGVLRPISPPQMIDLIAGETALIRPGDAVMVTEFEPSRLKRQLSWQDGEVWLKGETLQEAITEFNRYNHQKLVVWDKGLAGRRVGGRFETTDVEGFVDALQHLFGVRVLAVRSGGRGASTLVLLPSDRDA